MLHNPKRHVEYPNRTVPSAISFSGIKIKKLSCPYPAKNQPYCTENLRRFAFIKIKIYQAENKKTKYVSELNDVLGEATKERQAVCVSKLANLTQLGSSAIISAKKKNRKARLLYTFFIFDTK